MMDPRTQIITTLIIALFGGSSGFLVTYLTTRNKKAKLVEDSLTSLNHSIKKLNDEITFLRGEVKSANNTILALKLELIHMSGMYVEGINALGESLLIVIRGLEKSDLIDGDGEAATTKVSEEFKTLLDYQSKLSSRLLKDG